MSRKMKDIYINYLMIDFNMLYNLYMELKFEGKKLKAKG